MKYTVVTGYGEMEIGNTVQEVVDYHNAWYGDGIRMYFRRSDGKIWDPAGVKAAVDDDRARRARYAAEGGQ